MNWKSSINIILVFVGILFLTGSNDVTGEETLRHQGFLPLEELKRILADAGVK